MSLPVVTTFQPGPDECNARVAESPSEPSVAEAFYDDFCGTRLIMVAPPGGQRPSVVREHRAVGDGFALEVLTVRGELEVRGDGPSKVIALWIHRGHVETSVRDATAVGGPGESLVVSTGTAPFRLRLRDAEASVAALDPSLLDRVAADVVLPDGATRPSPYLVSLVPAGPDAARLWTRTHGYVAETMNAGDAKAPLVAANLGRLMALTAITVFGTQGGRAHVVRRTDGDEARSYPSMLRKAMVYIEAHARYDVSVNDVAAAVFLTPRALQYMFRKHLDVTPMAYLRRIRLEHVHAELVRSTRRTTTVSTSAARWGFAHTGRFAVLYRETYGRSPHVTLRD